MLSLLHESNPSLLDWLRSPTYIDDPSFTSVAREVCLKRDEQNVSLRTQSISDVPLYPLRKLARKHRSRKALAYHYISVARKHHNLYFESNQTPLVIHKKYVFVLRPLLAVKWLFTHPALEHNNLPPIDFEQLLNETQSITNQEREAILSLMKSKRSGSYGLRLVDDMLT